MLHELLLSLHGYPGSLFVESPSGNYSVVKDIPFIHPSEMSILNGLCELVASHQRILSFIRQHGKFTIRRASNEDNIGLKEGLYLKALCRGVDQVLEPYRQLLLLIEEEILKNSNLPLTHIQQSLEEYHLLFPALVNLIDDIKVKHVHGCCILDVVHNHKASGIPSVHNAMTIIMHSCHSVMFKQLSAWLLYGLLTDPHQEFFIQRKSFLAKADCSDGEIPDEMLKPGTEARLLDGEYLLQPDMLPVYIPTSLAEKMCFVGESIQLLDCKEHKNSSSKSTDLLDQSIIPKKDHFVQSMMELEQQEFHFRKFETVINDIRSCVAEQLWKLVVEEVDLVGHLQIMKDFYLLGRGELFQAFIEQAGTYLQHQVSSAMEHNINMAFHAAMHSVTIDDETLSEKFQLMVKTGREKVLPNNIEFPIRSGTMDIGWNNITLTCNVPWPLHIVFTKSILEKYNVMFRFLMHVKRVQLDLQHCWTLQMQWKMHKRDESFPLAWKLRNLMAFVVNNLQYYLQVDVLESQHSLLLERIQSTHDFEAIKHAHEQFIISLLAQAFLSTKAIAKCIMEILELCISFCQQFLVAASLPPRLVESYPMHATTFTAKMVDMQKQFHLQASLLFQILSSSQTYQASPFVAQLLMRLDYNKYFSSGQLGL